MSTEQYKNFVRPFSVIDDRLGVSDMLDYAVMKGAQESTIQRFPANSASSSSHVYNINISSKNALLDRRIVWHSKVKLKLSATNIPATYRGNLNLVNVGSTDALAPFPLHMMCQNIQATINSNTVSVQMQDVLPQLLRLNNKNDLLAYNGSTPCAYDTFYSYADSYSFNSNALGAINNSPDEDINFRGSYPVKLAAAPIPNGQGGNNPNPATVYTQDVEFEVWEPLLLSPFMYGQPQNKSAMFGINNMSFMMNIGRLNRVWRHAAINTGTPASDRSWNITVADVTFTDPEMIFNFLTPPNSMTLPPRCIVPYYNLNRMLLSTNGNIINHGQTSTIQSNAVTIEQIPDKFVICVRKRLADQTCQDSDSFWPITKMNITFNNKAGYCSGWAPIDFYKAAREAGSNQSWLEFYGTANTQATDPLKSNKDVKTSGSLVVLEVGKDLVLGEEYLAPGVGGGYGLQFSVEVTNPSDTEDLVPEIVLIAINSGVFKLEDGSSEVKTAVLLPSEVTAASKETPIVHANLRRMVGSGFVDSLKNAWKRSGPLVKHGVTAADALTADGLSASGLSGAAIRHHKSLKDRLK